jgi:hypothetical protein
MYQSGEGSSLPHTFELPGAQVCKYWRKIALQSLLIVGCISPLAHLHFPAGPVDTATASEVKETTERDFNACERLPIYRSIAHLSIVESIAIAKRDR